LKLCARLYLALLSVPWSDKWVPGLIELQKNEFYFKTVMKEVVTPEMMHRVNPALYVRHPNMEEDYASS
jgi:hypothetical protein